MSFSIFTHNPILTASDTIVFMDFDNTIIDYEKYKNEVWYKAFLEEGFEIEEIDKGYQVRNSLGLYEMRNHAEFLTSKQDSDEVLKRILERTKNIENYIFDDAKNFIENISNRANLVLLSFGELKFQQHKFLATGLQKYFQDSIFTQISKPEFFNSNLSRTTDGFNFSIYPDKKFRRIIFIDDHPKEFDGISNDLEIISYRLLRQNAKYSHFPTGSNIIEISTLENLDIFN